MTEFEPWKFEDGKCIRAEQSEWDTIRRLQTAACVAESSESPDRYRPLIRVTTDVFRERTDCYLHDLFGLIDSCPNLDFLIETEFPERVHGVIQTSSSVSYSESKGMHYRDNLHLAAIVNNQLEADERIPQLLHLKDLCKTVGVNWNPCGGEIDFKLNVTYENEPFFDFLVIGEKSVKRQTSNLAHIRSVIGECENAGVEVRIRSLGNWPTDLQLYAETKR